MNKFFKKLALVLSFAMVFTAMPMSVFAATANNETDLQAAFNNGGEVVLDASFSLNNTITVPAGKTVTLDLNGKTISYTSSTGAGDQAIRNEGILLIKDSSVNKNGKITFESTTPSASYGYSTSTIINVGTLTVESGTVENTTTGGASYAIDNAWYTTDVALTVSGGKITAKGIAVRQCLFSDRAKNTINITGGELEGGTAGLQLHNYQTTACLSDINISGGKLTGAYSFYTTYSYSNTATGTDIEITGGTFDGYLYLYNAKAGSSDYPFAVAVKGGTFNVEPYIYTTDAAGNDVYPKVIAGGTFDVEPSAENIVDGYGSVSENGSFVVKAPSTAAPEAEPVATTGEHVWGYNPQYDAAAHWDYCHVCGAQNTPVAHSDANGDGVCDCGWVLASTPSRANPNTGVTAEMLK